MRLPTARRWPDVGHARSGRPASRRGFRVTVLAVVMIAAGMTAGSAAAVGQQAVSLRLVYSCAFPAGAQPVSVQVSGAFPAAGTAGKAITPTSTGITVTLPHRAITNLAQPHAATVTLTAALSTGFSEGTTSATATWGHFVSAPAAIPRTGSLTLATTGAASPVTAAAAGQGTVTAGDLSLLFATRPANGGQAGLSSTPVTGPSSTPVTCVPGTGQDTTLARIAVAGSAPAKTPVSPQGPAPKACRPFPKNLKLNPHFPLPPPLKGSRVFHDPEDACAYATGFTNAAKFHEAALVGPGLTDLLLGETVYSKSSNAYTYEQIREPGELEYNGRPELPPARATFLGFGFMPVSATLQISEIGTLNADLIACGPVNKCPTPPPGSPRQKNIALFYVSVKVSISDVDVNGVPLNVGLHCQTAPFDLDLTGLPPSYNIGNQFGVLTGTVTVPPFTGCANGTDNLDSIFTASVSGPGNFVKVNQGVFCTPQGGCPPVKPPPKH
jgi:uncharacterized protein DUF6801